MSNIFNCYSIEVTSQLFFGTGTKTETYSFALLQNASAAARHFSSCEDIVGEVDIINDFTGEIVATFENGESTYLATDFTEILTEENKKFEEVEEE